MAPIATEVTTNGTNGTHVSSKTPQPPLSATAHSFHPTADMDATHASTSRIAIDLEHHHAAHNYHPLPIVFAKALGTRVWDPEGREYLDCLSAYSAVNQGHCHPELIKVLIDQASTVTLSSRAFYNDVFPKFAEKVTTMFGYEMVLPTNTGAEAVETSIKIARKWGYKVKKIPQGKAIIMGATNNFHGRTWGPISLSTDPESRDNYGPFLPNTGSVCPSTNKPIRYNSVPDLAAALEAHGKETAAFIVEPIQGEAGIVVPDDDYLDACMALCKQHNVLFICDEIQTGIARTGKLLCCHYATSKPDMVVLGKAISGGMYPVSCVLGSRELMLTIEPGTHGSTFGGNPLGSALAIRALELVEEQNMSARAAVLGELFRSKLRALDSPRIQLVRGKGLLNAFMIDETKMNGHSAWDLCMMFKAKGMLAKPTHQNIIRLAPPLVITETEIEFAVRIIGESLEELPKLKKGAAEDAVIPPGEKGVTIGIEN